MLGSPNSGFKAENVPDGVGIKRGELRFPERTLRCIFPP